MRHQYIVLFSNFTMQKLFNATKEKRVLKHWDLVTTIA